MNAESETEYVRALADALKQVRDAIALLDRVGAPSQIAAHLDLGRHQLEAAIGSAKGQTPSGH